jgi:tetratricopeptide (TPR) repeat protein
MRKLRFIFLLLIVYFPMWGQIDKKEVRRGNREFKKENYEAAFQDYLRAVGKDTSSIAANYNMASALYRMEQYDQAQQALDRIKESAPSSARAAISKGRPRLHSRLPAQSRLPNLRLMVSLLPRKSKVRRIGL